MFFGTGKKKRAASRAGEPETAIPAAEAARRRWRSMYLSPEGLRLAAAITGELARLTTMEMKVRVEGGEKGKFLSGALEPFAAGLRRELEYGLTDGGLVFRPYYDGKELRVEAVRGDCFIPVSTDGAGRVTEAVFLQEVKGEDVYYTRVERPAGKGRLPYRKHRL